MKLAMVVPVDPTGGGILDVREGLVRAVVEDRGADAFDVAEAVDCLHEIVEAPSCQLLALPVEMQ